MIDWADPKRSDVIRFQMVDPNNLDDVYGDIEDVQLGSSPITYGYYADTRYSSKISFLADNNYVDKAWIRIIHEVPSEGYFEELGTFIPVSPTVDYGGAIVKSFSLQSPLWGLSGDLVTKAFSVGKNSSILSAFKRVCEACNRPYLLQNPNDYLTTKAIVYEAGESYLSVLFDLANTAGNRLDVDGHGRITLSPAPDFQSLTPLWELDADDPRSIIVQDSIKMESEADDVPSRVIVISKSYVGVADLPAGSEHSAAQRGYVFAQAFSESKVSSKSEAQAMAQMYLNSYADVAQWSMKTLYFPAHCGDSVVFTINGERHICLIQSIDPVDLKTMTMDITLEEV